jgi:hypothetical protein
LLGLAAAGAAQRPSAVGLSAGSRSDGKRLTVRVYRADHPDPRAYESLDLVADRGSVEFPSDQYPPDALFVVTRWDQSDPSVLGDWHNEAIVLSGPTRVYLPMPGFGREAEADTLADGLGQPIPAEGLSLTVLIVTQHSVHRSSMDPAQYRRITLDGLPVDAEGRVWSPRVIASGNGIAIYGMIFHVPGYGDAWELRPIDYDSPELRLPLVAPSSPGYARALRGRVLNPDGRPLAGAVVSCRYARTAGEGLIASDGARVLTDAEGQFALYLSSQRPGIAIGEIIPPMTRYSYEVWAPETLGLMPAIGEAANDEPVDIQFKSGDASHTFLFLDEQGAPIPTDGSRPLYVYLARPDDGARTPVPGRFLREGGRLPFGNYHAELLGASGRNVGFQPVKVEESTPELLVFSPQRPVQYRGRVVDGRTDRPLAGAWVIGLDARAEGRMADLTSEQWDAIERLGGALDVADPALQPLQRVFVFRTMTRTAPDGSFTLVSQAGIQPDSLVALGRDWLAFMAPVLDRKPDLGGLMQLPTMRLFPAARVVVKLVVPGGRLQQANIVTRWVVDPEFNPAWARELSSWMEWQPRHQGMIVHEGTIRPEVASAILVPAGVNLRLRLETPYEEALDEVLLDRSFNLRPGETLDLGEAPLAINVMIGVRVQNAGGEPVEGVPLRLNAGSVWEITHNTDAAGIAYFYAPVGRNVRIGHSGLASDFVALEIELSGRETEPPVYVLTLSDAQIRMMMENR